MSKVLRPAGSKCTQVYLTLGAFPYSIFQPNVINIAEDVNIIEVSHVNDTSRHLKLNKTLTITLNDAMNQCKI